MKKQIVLKEVNFSPGKKPGFTALSLIFVDEFKDEYVAHGLVQNNYSEYVAKALTRIVSVYVEPDESDQENTITIPEVRKCRVCGCTDDHACEGGCYWVAGDLCSQCADKIVSGVRR